MKKRAYCKVNLGLDVFALRENGYHELKSIMVPINFYDELEIRINEVDDYHCNRNSIYFDKHNSVIKMINIFQSEFNINDHYYIDLKKSIPMKAGLGGGTSDAAATLKILCVLYRKKLSAEQIKKMCLQVGTDVYFNYMNTTSVVEGIGDIVTPFKIKKQYYVLLVKPRRGISTKAAYDKLDLKLCDHPDIDKLKYALENGEKIDGLLGNSLEQPAFLLNEEVRDLKQFLIDAGAKNVLMSGSGSTVFVLSEHKQYLLKLEELVKKQQYFTRLTKTL